MVSKLLMTRIYHLNCTPGQSIARTALVKWHMCTLFFSQINYKSPFERPLQTFYNCTIGLGGDSILF